MTWLVILIPARNKISTWLRQHAGVYLHGIGGRTVDKVFQYDLPFLKSQHSDIIILELGTNDLSFLSPEAVGSRLEDSVSLLRDNLHVSVVALCQVIDRYLPHSQTPDTVFNTKAALLRQYLSAVLDNMPSVFLWEHRNICKLFFCNLAGRSHGSARVCLLRATAIVRN